MVIWSTRRTLQAIGVLLAMSVIVFAGVFAIGNPADILLSPDADQEERARVIAQFGFDQPLWRQYLTFLANLLQGDLGRSFVFNEPAIQLILQKMPATMELAIFALLISIAVGVPAGLYCGLRPDTPLARGLMAASIFGFSMPSFWVGMLLIMIFGVQMGILPTTGRGATVEVLGIEWSFLTWDGLKHLLLPGINLALFKAAIIMRLTRAGVREILPLDFIRFARAKGLASRRIIGVHVMRNIMIPIVTVVGIEFGSMIAFAVVTESIFSWPGMGKLIIDSINLLDRPVIVSYLMIVVVLFTVINLVVDLLYTALDPRVRLDEQE
ncbi:MAG TPA: ABC transporter permease [Hyphomicrobiaceae bacterium]|nr:ABC transporter permease [Hyphomicrobiaceae bacterium]